MILEFRAKMPDGKWFYQRNQYLPSFLRRVMGFYGTTHASHLEEELENYLEIRIGDHWEKCEVPEFFRGDKQ